jgi:hypothetical protein
MAIEKDDGPRKHVIPPAVMANRMSRYSVYLMACAFLLLGANYADLSLSAVLWFAAGLCATFGLLCAVTVIVLRGVAWNFDRLAEELRGGRSGTSLRG